MTDTANKKRRGEEINHRSEEIKRRGEEINNRGEEINNRSEEKTRSGVFHSKSGDDYVVLWQGREICRYKTIEDFVEAHKQGLDALDANQADLLESYYRSIGISTGKDPGRSGRP